MIDEHQRAAEAVNDAVQKAETALAHVIQWCEAVRRDATRRHGKASAEWDDPACMQALVVRGRIADATRNLQAVAEELQKARDITPA